MTEIQKIENKNTIKISTDDQKLESLDQTEYFANLEESTLTLTPVVQKQDKQNEVNWWTFILSLLTTGLGVVFFLYLKKNQIPFTGSDSIFTIIETVGVLTGTVSMLLSFWYQNQKMSKNKLRLLVLGLSFAVILEFATVLLAQIINQMFAKSTFDLLTSILLLFLFSMLINSTMWIIGDNLSLKRLIGLLSIVILVGTFASMLMNGNEYWWQNNFSFLGTTDAINRWQFNITLIVSGLLLIILINTLFTELYKKFGFQKKMIVLNVLLTLVAINLGSVGLFPYSEGRIGNLHNFVAQNLVLLILVLNLSIRWLMPVKNKEFTRFSILIAAGLVVVSFLYYGIAYFSLTVFEMFAFILAFWWLLSLMDVLVTAIEKKEVYQVQVDLTNNKETESKNRLESESK